MTGARDVARALDAELVTERTNTLVRQLEKLLDKIGVPVLPSDTLWDRYNDVKITKEQKG